MKKVVLLSLLLCLATVSCSRGFIFRAINNSGQDLVITSYDGKLVPHEFPVAAGAAVDVQFPTRLSIRRPDEEWQYDLDFAKVDRRYEYKRTGGLRVQDIQIEADGAIYLLPPKTKQAITEFPPQPPGFPLLPCSLVLTGASAN